MFIETLLAAEFQLFELRDYALGEECHISSLELGFDDLYQVRARILGIGETIHVVIAELQRKDGEELFSAHDFHEGSETVGPCVVVAAVDLELGDYEEEVGALLLLETGAYLFDEGLHELEL